MTQPAERLFRHDERPSRPDAARAPASYADLLVALTRSTGLPPTVAARVVEDVLAYFGETAAEFVRRRHGELQRRGHTNERIFALIAEELRDRRVAAPQLSTRQLRRLVYG